MQELFTENTLKLTKTWFATNSRGSSLPGAYALVQCSAVPGPRIQEERKMVADVEEWKNQCLGHD